MNTILLTLAIFVVVAVWALAAVALVLRLMGRMETNTEDTEFSLAAARLRQNILDIQITFTDALTPALIRATEAINAFGKALGRAAHNQESKP